LRQTTVDGGYFPEPLLVEVVMGQGGRLLEAAVLVQSIYLDLLFMPQHVRDLLGGEELADVAVRVGKAALVPHFLL
jgi:hypothetical protein